MLRGKKEDRRLDRIFVPAGRPDSSPAIHCRVLGTKTARPSGTLEHVTTIEIKRPAGTRRGAACPGNELPGYCQSIPMG